MSDLGEFDDIPDEPEDDLEHPDDALSPEPMGPREIHANLIKQIDEINIADRVDTQTLETLGQLVVTEFGIDETSRAEWKDQIDKAMAFATQEPQEKQFPWPKASSTIYPIITSAALQFQARTYPAIIQNRNVAKGVVWGSDKGTPAVDEHGQPVMGPDQQPVWLSAPGEKRTRADKIGQHLSFQLLEEMPEWEPQTDMMLGVLPIVGGFVRKTYYDPIEKKNCSPAVRITDLVWNFYAPSFEMAPRHTEIVRLYPTEIETLERSGVFLPHEYGPGSEITDNTGTGNPTPSPSPDPDAPIEFLEQHRRYDLDQDGYAEPYVVTVGKRDGNVVRVTARYDEDGIQMGPEGVIKIKPWDHYTLYPFLPNPKSGSHPLGWGHVLKPLNEAVNTCFNQMFDAGTLQNAGGGFIGTGLSLHAGPVNFQVGRYVPVNNKGLDIRNSVYPIPWPGPSAVLFQLLELLIGAAKELSATQDILSGDALQANMQPTTLLALIEQGAKYYTSIQKRLYRAMKMELQKLYDLNRKFMKEKSRYRVGDEWLEVTPDDYRLGGGVEPIADPTMVTDMQRMGRAQVLMSMAQDPMVNGMEVRRRFFEMIGVDRIDEILVPPNPLPAQMALAKAQGELAELRSLVQKNTAQALLFMSQAQSEAGTPVAQMAENLLEMIRLHLEALNTANKASEIQSKHHVGMEGIKQDARNTAAKLGAAATGGTKTGGVQSVAESSGQPTVSPIPAGSSPGLPGPGDSIAAE